MSTGIRRSDVDLLVAVVLVFGAAFTVWAGLAKWLIDDVAIHACHETAGVWVDSAEVCVHVRLLEPKRIPVVHPDGSMTFTVAKDWRHVSENTGKYLGSHDSMATPE